MGQNFSARIAFGMVLLTSATSSSAAAQSDETRPTLSIRMFNYSSAPAVVLVKAAAQATRIFAQSGIFVEWTYCPARRSSDSYPACDSQPSPGEIRVRVLGHPLNNVFQDSIFGFAIAPTFATVYYDSAQLLVKTESDSESYLPIVLGGLMAHEIGHLLLGENQHTVSGIMQARWDIRQIQQLLQGALQFNPNQVTQMRVNSRIRERPPAADAVSSVEMARFKGSIERR